MTGEPTPGPGATNGTAHGERLPIADTPGALTPEWLTWAMGDRLGGASVTGVHVQLLGTGQMCDSVRLRLRYDRGPGGPPTLVAKLPAADPTSRATAVMLRCYETEVRFYQQLSASLPVHTPAVLHADIDADGGSFVLLLEDLAPAEPGDQLAGCTPEQAAIAVGELVRLHAPRWGDPALATLPWLHRDPEANRAFLAGLLPSLWDGFRDRYGPQLGPEVHRAGDSLFAALGRYLSPDSAQSTVVHGDYRLDNLLFDDERATVAVVDWQMAAHGPALGDVAYFIGAGLLPDDRRPHEADLVRRYHHGLVAAGVTGYEWERCWRDYRRASLGGLVMAVAASMLVERTDRGDEMFLAMAHRHAQHALDLDAPAVL